MPEEKKVFTPSRGYDITLTIKNLDYSNDLRSVRVVSAISTAYQIVTFSLSLDPSDLIIDKIMSKDPIWLSIQLIGDLEVRDTAEHMVMELQYITSTSSAPSKLVDDTTGKLMKDRTIVNVVTINRKPFKTMTTLVNGVYENSTPKEIITSLVSEYTDATLEYDTNGENNEKIDQILIPPSTLYNAIKYLDQNFGLFRGISNSGFCQLDNVVRVQNLTARMQKDYDFLIYHLATDDPDVPKIMEEVSAGDGTYYTYMPLILKYTGTSKFATLAKNIKHIVKPKDSFYRIIDQQLDEVCLNYGLIDKSEEILIDPNLADREVYNVRHSGNDSSDVYANTTIAKQISGMTTVEVTMERKIRCLILVDVGYTVKLICQTLQYASLSGKYILRSSDLQFVRETATWESIAKLSLMRTNQYIS